MSKSHSNVKLVCSDVGLNFQNVTKVIIVDILISTPFKSDRSMYLKKLKRKKKKKKKKKLLSLKVENNALMCVIINILLTVVNQHILLMKTPISLSLWCISLICLPSGCQSPPPPLPPPCLLNCDRMIIKE